MGVLSRELRDGAAPVDGFLFADVRLMWFRSRKAPPPISAQ
jgi:hypothetical protein